MHPLTAETFAARGPSIWFAGDKPSQSEASEQASARQLIKGRGAQPKLAGGTRKHVDMDALRAYRLEGHTIAACAVKFDVGPGVIMARLKEMGL